MSDISEGETFGMLLGVIGLHDMGIGGAIDIVVEKGADREIAERLAAKHWDYENE